MDTKTRDHRDDHHDTNTQSHQSSSTSSSSSSSPNHEFSFTISVHSVPDKNRASSAPSSIAAIVDLSPADDIFFHGHLLPLHLISHLPRYSATSIDTFSLPTDHHHPIPNQKQSINGQTEHQTRRTSNRKPSRPFSLFWLTKWRKGFGDGDRGESEPKQKSRKLRLHVIERYARMVRPLALLGRMRMRSKENVREPPYSFSGDSKGGEWVCSSAPASKRTSPANSGLLVAAATNCSMRTTDSTMEELQAAIQAAIAHCKNSIAAEEKRKMS